MVTCGACCLLRHSAGRYQKHKPNERTAIYERVAKLDGVKRTQPSEELKDGLVLIAPFDGIGGARRALDLLKIEPALYLSVDTDQDCHMVVRRAWPDAVLLGAANDLNEELLRGHLDSVPRLGRGLVIGGPPCQGFSQLNSQRKGFDDPRSNGVVAFAQLCEMVREVAPDIQWDFVMENVASMTNSDRDAISVLLKPVGLTECYWFDAVTVGPVRRPRLYWTSWDLNAVQEFEKVYAMGMHRRFAPDFLIEFGGKSRRVSEDTSCRRPTGF